MVDVVVGGAHEKFSPFVDRLLLWQQVACQSKKDFGKSVLRCGCPSPTIFEKIRSPLRVRLAGKFKDNHD